MSALKDQDPDYGPSVASNEKHQRIYEENARNSTARKITAIVEKEFSQEIACKEREILEIHERLHKTLKTLHLLRYVVVADFYGRKQCQNIPVGEPKQTQIHPAIKELIGKSPKVYNVSSVPSTSTEHNSYLSLYDRPVIDVTIEQRLEGKDISDIQEVREKRKNEDDGSRPKKIPRYVPPKSGIPESPDPSRNSRHKVRKRIIVGNISKWIPLDWREDTASHKWTMYVRGDKDNPDINDFVTKVRFFLHPSYRPNDVVEVTSAPFCLSRRGWGEFPVRVQLHFKSAFDKPMDIIHHLKLDRTYTGLQTLGSETLVDIWIFGDSKQLKRSIEKEEQNVADTELQEKLCTETVIKTEPIDTVVPLKSEPIDFESNLNSLSDRPDLNQKGPNVEIHSQHSISEHDKVLTIQRLRFCVQHDHDYIETKYIDSFTENNLTIKHSLSPEPSISIKVENSNAECIVTRTENMKDTKNSFTPSIDLKEQLPKEDEKDFSTNENSSLLIKGGDGKLGNNRNRIILDPSSRMQKPVLQPLQISIPPPFEPIGSKRVLVLQNDKTIPVNITSSRPSNSFNGSLPMGSKVKLNFSQGKGLSLLKKRANVESGDEIGTSSTTNGNLVNLSNLKIKSSTTLLLNVNSNVPTLKIVEKQCTPTTSTSLATLNSIKSEEQSEYVTNNKITLGKDKYKLQSRKDIYEKTLQTIESATISDVLGLLRFIIRRLPIIAPEAVDSDYRRLHPYACKSEEKFFEHNIAKRRAIEWNRASVARQFLVQKDVSEEEMWTVKEIMIWARLHGYTPVRSQDSIHPSSLCNRTEMFSKSTTSPSTYEETCSVSEPLAFHKWLQNYPKTLKNNAVDVSRDSNAEHEIIDIENENSAQVVKREKFKNEIDSTECTKNDSKVIMVLPKHLMPLYQFVTESTHEIGIKLTNEEIEPNFVHCAAARMIMRAVECFVEDLARGALANAWERNSDNGCPKAIALDDVRRAIFSRKEFDLFTNEGLGSNYRSMLMD